MCVLADRTNGRAYAVCLYGMYCG